MPGLILTPYSCAFEVLDTYFVLLYNPNRERGYEDINLLLHYAFDTHSLREWMLNP